MEKYFKDILTPAQILKIEQFNADNDMKEAVQKVLLAGLYSHGVVEKGKPHNPLINGAFSLVALAGENPIPDAELGAHLRGTWFGINALQNAWNKLITITSEKKEAEESPYNDAI